jgi:hypothetical protein
MAMMMITIMELSSKTSFQLSTKMINKRKYKNRLEKKRRSKNKSSNRKKASSMTTNIGLVVLWKINMKKISMSL